jgi:hypothetical protein
MLKSLRMFPPDTRLVLAVSWVAFVLIAAWTMGASSGASLVLLAIVAILPPAVMIALWTNGPPPTIAEVLHEVERKW